MDTFIEPIGRLINEFSKLPGVGRKTAQRYAYHIIGMQEQEALAFADAIVNAKKKVRFCKICGNFAEEEICPICRERDPSVICVVKEPKDVVCIERIHDFRGAYHVLHGVIDPINGVTPNKLHIRELVERIEKGNVQEVIMATNPDVEGEATAAYLAKLLKPLGVKVTRLSRGIPIGSELEYADEATLTRALQERKEL